MAKAVRLADIGKRLNVSAVTVSKALSGQKGVSDEMRSRIIETAQEMGYMKSAPEEKKSYTIGVVAAERYLAEGQSFYWQLYQEISQRAITVNCFTILEIIEQRMEKRGSLPRIVTEKKVDGLIVMGAFQSGYANYLAETVRIPFLFLDTPGTLDTCDSVVANNLMGGYRMTNYLFEMGHTRIGYVGTLLATTSIDDRYLGYIKSLMGHGIPLRQDWVIEDRDRESGVVDAEEKFRLPSDMPTAFFCNCDMSACILIRKLNQLGYSVPEDISVVGFDNFVTERFGEVGLTTYEIKIKEMARRAVHILTHKLNNSNYSTGMFMLPGTFIERNSVKRIGPEVPFI